MNNIYTNPTLKDIKSIGIVLRPSSPDIKETFLLVKNAFELKNVEVLIDSQSAAMIKVLGTEFNTMITKVDFLVSIGGDGTLISAVRRSFGSNKPVLGINMGKLGFLTDLKPHDIESFIDKLFTNDYRIDNRLVLQGSIVTKDLTQEFFGFNDFVLTRKSIANTIKLQASINNKVFNTYKGDGLIISTPTGSTAYNLSSDGPLLYPFTQAYIINPICPHSLTQRPLVLPSDFEISIKSSDDEGGMIIVDGQDIYTFDKQHTINIKVSSTYAQLIHESDRDYFDVLKDKLNWGDD